MNTINKLLLGSLVVASISMATWVYTQSSSPTTVRALHFQNKSPLEYFDETPDPSWAHLAVNSNFNMESSSDEYSRSNCWSLLTNRNECSFSSSLWDAIIPLGEGSKNNYLSFRIVDSVRFRGSTSVPYWFIDGALYTCSARNPTQMNNSGIQILPGFDLIAIQQEKVTGSSKVIRFYDATLSFPAGEVPPSRFGHISWNDYPAVGGGVLNDGWLFFLVPSIVMDYSQAYLVWILTPVPEIADHQVEKPDVFQIVSPENPNIRVESPAIQSCS